MSSTSSGWSSRNCAASGLTRRCWSWSFYAFSFSVNTVATGAVTEATNLSVGIVDEDGSTLSRHIAEALLPPTFQPPVQITASDIDP